MNKWIFIGIMFLTACRTHQPAGESNAELNSNITSGGFTFTIEVTKGAEFNHPTFAFWAEDLDGNYIETLFVTKSIAKGIFGYGELAPGKWSSIPGEVRRPAALPYWSHKRGIKAPDGLYTPSPETAVPDAISGATPKDGFILNTALTHKPSGKFRIFLEVNQPWDSNKYWFNNKIPGDLNYFASLQPSLIYAAVFDPENMNSPVELIPIGHGEPSGKNGQLYSDLSTITTAKEIFSSIRIVKKQK